MHAIIESLRQHVSLSWHGTLSFLIGGKHINSYNTYSMLLLDVLVSRGLRAQIVNKRVMGELR